MKVIGLTGGIASGKSTVSLIFKKYGFAIIDGDVISREIMRPGSFVLEGLKLEFGEEIINNDGTLDRKKLSGIVFENNNKLEKLNSITHPIIREQIVNQIEHYRSLGCTACIVDGALLIEGKFTDIVDVIIVIKVDRELQIKRLIERDKISAEAAQNIIDKQMPFEEKRKHADFVIDNSYDIEYTKKQINTILSEILGLEGSNV